MRIFPPMILVSLLCLTQGKLEINFEAEKELFFEKVNVTSKSASKYRSSYETDKKRKHC